MLSVPDILSKGDKGGGEVIGEGLNGPPRSPDENSMESWKPSLELPEGKKIPAALVFFFSGAASPRTKDMQIPEIFHERGCSNDSSNVTAAVAKRVSKWKGCDCDKE
ncbi:hypothetical protein CDAR_423701 [Caerostris darwini]|uniref:Uncharacterized protein n=1 Tax=Caerostris darwini TaxID=1538125 RepID=A0AAV4VAA9_9ARAC|nr:hypothetical protein CDAR_423701 [Caerostris darwini]